MGREGGLGRRERASGARAPKAESAIWELHAQATLLLLGTTCGLQAMAGWMIECTSKNTAAACDWHRGRPCFLAACPRTAYAACCSSAEVADGVADGQPRGAATRRYRHRRRPISGRALETNMADPGATRWHPRGFAHLANRAAQGSALRTLLLALSGLILSCTAIHRVRVSLRCDGAPCA